MKKATTILAVVVSAFLLQAGCHSFNNTGESAQNNNSDTNRSPSDYRTDIYSYKQQSADSIKANQKLIDKFSKDISQDRKEINKEYKKTIDALEIRNNELKREIDDYTAEGKDKWDTFKVKFNKDMGDLNKSIKSLRDTTK